MNSDSPASLPKVAWCLPAQYNDNSFWIRGHKAKIGAPDEKLVYIGVGHALSNWEHVESAGAMFFSTFIESASIAGTRAYGTINGSRAREAALRQAADTFFSLQKSQHRKNRSIYDEIIKSEKIANCLIKNYSQASARRNDIAHGVAQELSAEKTDKYSWFLVAQNYQSTKTVNWIEDDVKLRDNKGFSIHDKNSYFDYKKFYYKNSQYVFGIQELKIFSGKFIYLYADILCFLRMFNPEKFKFTPEEIYVVAKALSQ